MSVYTKFTEWRFEVSGDGYSVSGFECDDGEIIASLAETALEHEDVHQCEEIVFKNGKWEWRETESGKTTFDQYGRGGQILLDYLNTNPLPQEAFDCDDSGNAMPVFFECTGRLSPAAIENIKEKIGTSIAGRKIVLLHDGLKLATQHAWRPANLDIQCGSISIKSGNGTLMGGSIVVDGQNLERVRRVAVEMDCSGNLPKVQIEFVPNFTDHE